MHIGRILVVALDDDLRRSLTFALAAYGHTVVAERQWPEEIAAEAFDCVVLDEPALSELSAKASVAAPPVLLLAYSEAAKSSTLVAGTIAMPLKGEAVIQAVAAAIAGSRASTK